MEFLVRTAAMQDAAQINDLYVQMLQSVYGETKETGYPAGALQAFMAEEENRIYVAEAEGELAAFLSLEVHREEESFVYCDDFCVHEAFRGMGIGSALLACAQEYAQSLGICTLMLHAERQNRAAIEFYVHRSFSVLAEEGTRLLLVRHPGPQRAAERIARMESHLDALQRAVREGDAWADPDSPLQAMLRELTDYYENGAWMEDYERDERGELPAGFKRGVLSEDAVYDLLCETDLEGSAVCYEDL